MVRSFVMREFVLRFCVCALMILAMVCYISYARAESFAALSLYGDIKYKQGFDHFDYTNAKAPKGGELRVASVGSFDSLNPYIIKGLPADGVDFLTVPTLMVQSYDEPFTVYGYLAETVDLSSDRSTVSFRLRENASWDDSAPITADDVVWSFNALIKNGAPFYRAYYADVKDVSALSKREVVFKLSDPNNRELPLIIAQMPILPKHFWVEKNFAQTTLSPPPSGGPYKIAELSPGRSISYTRIKDWWGANLNVNRGRYNFDKITYQYYRDQNVALEAFFAGEFDIQQENVSKLWQSAYNAPPVLDGRIVKQEIENHRPVGMQAFIYNIRRPIFSDIKVREALSYAFDFEWENRQFMFGAYYRTKSFFENSDLASSGVPSDHEIKILETFRDKIPPQLFTDEFRLPITDGSGNNRENLKKATDLLEAAGYKLGADGVRVQEKTGLRLEFEFIDANPALERLILPFIQNLKKIGVKANLRMVDEAQYTNRMQNFDFDMTSSVIPQSTSPGNEQREFWMSDKADVVGSRNYIGIKNPVVDELVKGIIAANTRDELITNTHALDRVLLWNYYVIPNWYYNKWRLAWWNHVHHPETLSAMTPAIVDTWWIDSNKAIPPLSSSGSLKSTNTKE